MASARGRFHVGTSGWVYRHWRGSFYPTDLAAKRHFAFYRERFATVELNNPFYRLPSEAAVARWRDETPSDFMFAVKASRFITHNKKLADPQVHLDIFFARMDALGDKMAVVLFQLPPSWHVDGPRLDAFLSAFRAREGRRRCVFEFRDPTWYDEEVYGILRRHDAAFCLYDLAGHSSPLEITAGFIYIRLHGPDGKYAGSYSDAALRAWARRITTWLDAGKDVFCYFDNDIGAHAPRNALTLDAMVAKAT